MNSAPTIEELVCYYEGKTESILKRYGPGPRVHYHTGLVDDPTPPDFSIARLRQRLVAAQERMLHHAAIVWDASSYLAGDLLDVGCGLGGGAIYWAQQFGAQVTAVTCVPSHLRWVGRFAEQAGVASQVRPVLSDALSLPGVSCFDAVVAIDSSCHLPREDWFRRISLLLRPGGCAFILDCFLVRPEYEEPFNRYWHTRIGTIDEYFSAARAAGLRHELVEDLSHRTEHFWTTTLTLIRAEAREKETELAEAVRDKSSLSAHTLVWEGLRDGGLRYALMSFSKNRPR